MQFLIAFTCGLICLLAVSAAPPTPEQIQHMKEAMQKCIKETGVDPESLKSLKGGEMAEDANLPCFGACMMKEMGIMNEAGELQQDKAIEKIPDHMPKEDAIKLMELCSKETNEDPCVTAGLVFKCLHENKAHELFQMPHD